MWNISYSKISSLGLLVELVGFVIIWRFGGLDGALSRLNQEIENLQTQKNRNSHLLKVFNQQGTSTTIARGHWGEPIVGSSLPDYSIPSFLQAEISSLDTAILGAKKRKEKFAIMGFLKEGATTAIGFIFVLIGVVIQLWASWH